MKDVFEQENMLDEDTQHGRFLTFITEGEIYGIEIRYVIEIIGLQNITRVPEVPDYVKGIINLRGKIVPVIDVRMKFGKEPIEYNERTCIVVIEVNEIAVGLIVDEVDEVMNISDENISDPPPVRAGFENKYIKGIGKAGDRVQLLLDCEKLLMENKIRN
jgi:purine-binding chemotaxis protein CheW